MNFQIKLTDRKTGEKFSSKKFETFEDAANYGEKIGDSYNWSIENC